MDLQTGKPDRIEDWLMSHKTGQWFGFRKDGQVTNELVDQTYANLVVLDGSTKPTEDEVNAGLKAMQDDFDAKEYARKRELEYPFIGEQLDQIYNEGIDAWKATIKAVKDKYPKP